MVCWCVFDTPQKLCSKCMAALIIMNDYKANPVVYLLLPKSSILIHSIGQIQSIGFDSVLLLSKQYPNLNFVGSAISWSVRWCPCWPGRRLEGSSSWSTFHPARSRSPLCILGSFKNRLDTLIQSRIKTSLGIVMN